MLWPELVECNTSQLLSVSHWITIIHHAGNKTRHILCCYQNVTVSSNPMEEHLQKALYIVRYLSSSKELCIVYSGTGDSNGLCAYSDTDWAGDVKTSRSTTSYAIFLGNGIVSWLSRWQQRVTLSSTEAEYCGRTKTAKQLCWIRNLYEELGFKLGPLPLCIDNQGATYIPCFQSCLRRTNKTCLDNGTFHMRISGVWRDQTLLCSYQSAIHWYLHEELGQAEIWRWKKGTSTHTLQIIVTFLARRSVENPGISYSDILILIPDSRMVYDLIFTLFILLILSR